MSMATADCRKRPTHVCRHERRKQRQSEAIARQEKRDRLSAQGQVALLDQRPGNSTRERAKLNV